MISKAKYDEFESKSGCRLCTQFDLQKLQNRRRVN